jgi:hypothetical protein
MLTPGLSSGKSALVDPRLVPTVRVSRADGTTLPLLPVLRSPLLPVLRSPLLPVLRSPLLPVLRSPLLPVLRSPLPPPPQEQPHATQGCCCGRPVWARPLASFARPSSMAIDFISSAVRDGVSNDSACCSGLLEDADRGTAWRSQACRYQTCGPQHIVVSENGKTFVHEKLMSEGA